MLAEVLGFLHNLGYLHDSKFAWSEIKEATGPFCKCFKTILFDLGFNIELVLLSFEYFD